jgi:hypothetical protein
LILNVFLLLTKRRVAHSFLFFKTMNRDEDDTVPLELITSSSKTVSRFNPQTRELNVSQDAPTLL